MSSILPPLGYSSLLTPESQNETYTYNVADKSVSLTKSAVHQFLESFLNPRGANRNFLKSTLSAEGLQYVTDLTYDDEMKANPNLRKTYLARFFAENTGRLPSVLIIDQGVEDGDVGLNSLLEGFSFKNQWKGKVLQFVKVSVSIMVATYSEEDTTTLSSTIYYIFNTLADAVNNRIIRPKGQKWEVRLPIRPTTASQLTSVPVEGNNKSQIWTRSIELICDFETNSTIQMPTPQIVPPVQLTVGQNPGGPIPQVLNLQPNEGVPLGYPLQLMIRNMGLNHYLGVSDPNVALISSEAPWYLQPRRQGKALLYIFDSRLPQGQDLITGRKKNLIVDIPFRVII